MELRQIRFRNLYACDQTSPNPVFTAAHAFTANDPDDSDEGKCVEISAGANNLARIISTCIRNRPPTHWREAAPDQQGFIAENTDLRRSRSGDEIFIFRCFSAFGVFSV
jgi:hypothetical protein